MRNQNSRRLDPPVAERLPRDGRVPPPSNPDPLDLRLPAAAGGTATWNPGQATPVQPADPGQSSAPSHLASRVRPIFVDRTGRRRRVAVLAGVALGAGLLVSLGLLAVGLLTGGSVAVPGWPDTGSGHLRDEAGTGRSENGAPASPTGGPARTAPAPAGTARPANPSARPASPPGAPTATDRPGQGDLHRNPSPGNPAGTDKPGKSRRSPAAVG
ncbi:hypothetical protein ABGB07_09600 [Micromonosporaceae bacterium B7E4]